MKDNLIFWKKKLKNSGSRASTIFIIAGLSIIVFCAAGVGFYMKKVNEEKLAAAQKLQQTKRTQEGITTFYRKAFTGIDLNSMPIVMSEIERSRIPFSIVGFTETEYNCSNGSCRFLYQLNDNFVFSVIDKNFFNTQYSGSFTENTLNFTNVMIMTDESTLLHNMNTGISVNAEKCSSVLNYLYGYNSVVALSDRVKVAKLPVSTVEAAEKQFPSYRNSYGLMIGEFEVQMPDAFSDAYLFAEKNPYKDLFIVQSIEKSAKTGSDVILKGVFVCKK